MIEIKANNANDLFIKISRELLENGKKRFARNLETIELENVLLTLTDPKNSIVTLPERKINMNYLNAEMEWYKNGDLSINKISKHSSFWSKIANPDNTVRSIKRHIGTNWKETFEGKE